MPTRGSPLASSWTSGRAASQSISRETSLTSRSGALREILPPDFPNPRADHVMTAYPSAANCSAWSRVSALLPPNPWPMSTAKWRCVPPVVKYEVSTDTPPTRIIRSCRWTAGALSSATAVQVPAPASTTSAAIPAAHRPRERGSRRRHLDVRAIGVSMMSSLSGPPPRVRCRQAEVPGLLKAYGAPPAYSARGMPTARPGPVPEGRSMDNPVETRRATTVAELEAAQHLYDGPARTEWAARFLAADGHLMVIAYVAGVPAGFVSGIEMLHPDKGAEMCLYELAVDAPYRRMGHRPRPDAGAERRWPRTGAATTCGSAWTSTTRPRRRRTARRARRTTGASRC